MKFAKGRAVAQLLLDPNSARVVLLMMSADGDQHADEAERVCAESRRLGIESEGLPSSFGREETSTRAGGSARPDEDVAILMSITGATQEQARMCLEAANGDRDRAAMMLLES